MEILKNPNFDFLGRAKYFAVLSALLVAGGIYVIMGPTVGAIITIMLTESLRIAIGVSMVGLDTTIYGILLVLFIIFLPKGIVGGFLDWRARRRGA